MKTVLSVFITAVCFFTVFTAVATPIHTSENGSDWPAVSEVAIRATSKGIDISWKAQTEQHDIVYMVEMTRNGKQFSQVAMVLAGFEENGRFVYKFREKRRKVAAVQYRILQIKSDGSTRVVGSMGQS